MIKIIYTKNEWRKRNVHTRKKHKDLKVEVAENFNSLYAGVGAAVCKPVHRQDCLCGQYDRVYI